MNTAQRLEGIGEYYFSQKLREIDLLNKQGKNIINLGIGSPDLAPHPTVIEFLNSESAKPNVHSYQNYKGSSVLRRAIAAFYKKWYNVPLDADRNILPLIGSKEGIMHICMAYLDIGDVALVPNPGYPTYSNAVKLAGGTVLTYELNEENNWQPDFKEISENDLSRVKLMFVNYPHMPTGQLPDILALEKLINWAKTNGILLIHDNAYSFILNDQPRSLLALPGAKDCVLELNSISKSHNMAGWRVGMLCGTEERIDEVLRFKSNMDSGMFLPVQLAAAKALELDENWFSELNEVYKKRRELVWKLADLLNCTYSSQQAGLFVWAKIPDTMENSYQLSDEILHECSVFITPGGVFGNGGEKYIRISLCATEATISEAIKRIDSAKKNR